MSKHVGEKCGKRADGDRTDGDPDGHHHTSCLKTGVLKKGGKLCISSILSFKRGITPTKIEAN